MFLETSFEIRSANGEPLDAGGNGTAGEIVDRDLTWDQRRAPA